MLVEINLLPQKEPRKFNILYLGIIVGLLVIIGGLYFWQIQTVKSDVEALDQKIEMTRKQAETEQMNANNSVSSNSAAQLETAVEWAEDYPIETIPVMRHLTALLPERGFIQSFAYSEAGTITLTVQFDTSREAAFFLDNLKDSTWITEATLHSLSIGAEFNEVTTVTQQQTVTTSTETSANTNNQNTETGTENPTTETNAAASNENIQTPAANQDTTDTTTTTSTVSVTEKPAENVLPRYVGQFEIKVNKQVIKEENQSKKTAEGGTGS